MNRQRQRRRGKNTAQKVLTVLIIITTTALALIILYGVSTRDRGANIEQETDSIVETDAPEPTPIPREDILTGVEHYNPLRSSDGFGTCAAQTDGNSAYQHNRSTPLKRSLGS